ncbi:MAG TPA: hypothetical protein RMH85_12965 [Polyangiaceae bacterium LLY-WYZ-15_(1-7)]|nr:hypothetical protein [Myxococcales bacterium]HJL03548.1 hypothetical protein [Polyangiaceae bacterium LLY-WYZ-15_(1-7)]HJL09410.1 hypothetical protein [Polyangiaceae bacterium LLY-WYZ-15_(1-7)]HJL44686.1 hypothetical protein [Polyangiaceae bacterium LLY-WYZ-15_(1-7)]
MNGPADPRAPEPTEATAGPRPAPPRAPGSRPAPEPEDPARALPSRRRRLAAVAFFALAWLWAFPVYPDLNNPNENVRIHMTAALAEDGTYEISGMRRRWGWVNDAACVEWTPEDEPIPCEGARAPAGHTRRYYSVKAPLSSWLGLPGYLLAQALKGTEGPPASPTSPAHLWAMRLFASGLPMMLFFGFFYGWLGARVRSAVIRDAVYVATALGSCLLGYAYLFASHSTSAAAAFTAFALLFDAQRAPPHARGPRPALRAFAAGLLAASASALEYPCFVATFALCVYALVALRPWPRILLFGAGALLPTLLVMHFQASAYGNPLTPGHLFVENAAFRAGHESGFFGADAFHADAAWRLLVDPRLGAFSLTPTFAFAFGALPALWARRRDRTVRAPALTALFLVAGMYGVICLMNNWEGGWSLGPRYLVVTLPFLAVAAAIALDRMAHHHARAAHALALGTALASLVAAGLPSAYYPHLPPEIDWPLVHLFPAVFEAGAAPHNAGALLFGLEGNLAMLPLALLALGSLVWASAPLRDPRLFARALLVALACLAPRWALAPEPDAQIRQSVGFILEHWSPRPAAWRADASDEAAPARATTRRRASRAAPSRRAPTPARDRRARSAAARGAAPTARHAPRSAPDRPARPGPRRSTSPAPRSG